MAVEIVMPKKKDPMSALTGALGMFNGIKGVMGGGEGGEADAPKPEGENPMSRKLDGMAITDPTKPLVPPSVPTVGPMDLKDVDSLSNPLKRRARAHGFMPEF